ncbi:MAG: preprotein translocase subunit YajC [Lachnospiraceae bacterium]|nr:preprotein translocase subunit YajC [Lachnospiraceae bacterium]
MNHLFLLAEAAENTGGFGSWWLIIYVVLIVAMVYFMIIRPQQKQRKEQEALMSTMEIGDSVMTTAGFYGVIIDMSEDTVIVEFGSNKNCRIPMQKQAIVQIEKPNKPAEN